MFLSSTCVVNRNAAMVALVLFAGGSVEAGGHDDSCRYHNDGGARAPPAF